MARSAVTYGFGRISSKSRPSPYSPVHCPSQMPGAPVSAELYQAPRQRSRTVVRAIVVASLVGALFGVVAFVASVWVRGDEPSTDIATRPASPPAVPLSEEAHRLSRSAIAVGRYTPRRGS